MQRDMEMNAGQNYVGDAPRPPQRVRKQDERTVASPRPSPKRRCQARIELPDRTGDGAILFACQRLPNDHATNPGEHREYGRVRAKDGHIIVYTFSWHEPDFSREVWRGAN
jgi:hypothetical protein